MTELKYEAKGKARSAASRKSARSRVHQWWDIWRAPHENRAAQREKIGLDFKGHSPHQQVTQNLLKSEIQRDVEQSENAFGDLGSGVVASSATYFIHCRASASSSAFVGSGFCFGFGFCLGFGTPTSPASLALSLAVCSFG